MDDAGGQVAGPALFEEVEFALQFLRQSVVDMAPRTVEQRPPAGDRQRIGPLQRKVPAGKVQRRQRLADRRAMMERDAARPQAVQEGRDCRRLAGQGAQRLAVAAVDRLGQVMPWFAR